MIQNYYRQQQTTTYASQTPSPAARKIIAEKGMDPATIQGTGKGGRITKEDAAKAIPSMGTQPDWGDRGQDRSKLSMLRRKVAERLVAAKNETAAFDPVKRFWNSRKLSISVVTASALSSSGGDDPCRLITPLSEMATRKRKRLS